MWHLCLVHSGHTDHVIFGYPRTFRALRLVAAVLVGAAALAGAVRLVAPATAGPDGEPPGVRRQLTFLRAALDDGAGC